MADLVECPQCSQKSRVTVEMIGRRIKCPTCGFSFQAELPPSGVTAMPEVVVLEEPATALHSQFGRADVDAWGSVRTGLKLHGIANLLLLAGWFVFFLYVLMLLNALDASHEFSRFRDESSGVKSPTILVLVNLCTTLLILAGWICGLIAACLWTAVPNQHNARGLAIACIVLQALLLILIPNLSFWLSILSSERGEFRHVLQVLPQLLGGLTAAMTLEIGRLTVLGAALRGFARCLRMERAAANGSVLMGATPAVLTGVMLLSVLLMSSADDSNKTAGLMFLVVNLLVYSGVLLLGLRLMGRLRRRIDRDYPPADD